MEHRERSHTVSLATLGVVVLAFVMFSVYLSGREAIDDAAISLAYGKHLIRGRGLVLNPGSEPVEGYSNFLWVLLTAPFTARGLDAVLLAKILGLAFSAGSLLLLAHIPGLVERRRMHGLDLLAPVLTSLAVPFALWSFSGLENGLESFLLVLAVALSMREFNDSGGRPWSSLGFFALALTRPEGVVFWLAALAHRVFLTVLKRKASRRDVEWIAAFLVSLALYHLWHYTYFGEVVPNTYFAKASDRSPLHLLSYLTDPSDPGFGYLRSFSSGYWLLPLMPFVGLCLTTRRGRSHYALPAAMLLAGLGAVIIDGGDWMPHYRLMSPLLPLFYLSIQEGVRSVSLRPRGVSASSITRTMRAAAAASITLAVVVATVHGTVTTVAAVHGTPYGADYSAVRARGLRIQNLAHCLALERPSVLTPDIGAFALNTNLRVIDLAGLGDAYIARHPGGPQLAEYVFGDRRPDIIWTHQVWLRGLDRDPRLQTDYTAIVMERDGAGNLVAGAWVRRDILLAAEPMVGPVPQVRTIEHDPPASTNRCVADYDAVATVRAR
jgi:hypothetical protein